MDLGACLNFLDEMLGINMQREYAARMRRWRACSQCLNDAECLTEFYVVQLRRKTGEAFIRLPSGPGLAQEHQAYVRAQIAPGPTQQDADAGQLVISQCHVSDAVPCHALS